MILFGARIERARFKSAIPIKSGPGSYYAACASMTLQYVRRMPRYIFITVLGIVGILTGQLPAGAQTFFSYQCGDGSEFVAAFYEGDKRAHLQLDGKAVALSKRVSLSGSRYAKGDITLTITKTVTTLKRGKRLTECKLRKGQ